MPRQIKNLVAHIGKISNPCYKVAVAALSPPDAGTGPVAVEDM
jgi:hypothetical protein